MARYIDADQLIDNLTKLKADYEHEFGDIEKNEFVCGTVTGLGQAIMLAKSLPTVDVAYGGPREGGKKFAENQALLYQLKREVHEKAVRPHNAGIDAYIGLKVFDAILQGYLNKLV